LISLRKAKLVRFGILRFGVLEKTHFAAAASRGVTRHERRPLIRLDKIGFASPKSPERVGGIAPGRAASGASSPRPIGDGRRSDERRRIIDIILA